jgi:two-component system chemotaxis response regulator CheY
MMGCEKLVVMVVDDYAAMRSYICDILKNMQFEKVVEAENGAEALKLLECTKVDLIVADWNMPVMNGLEFLKKVRADERYNAVPFLMVTAYAEKDAIFAALDAKVSDYIIKPFSIAGITEKVTRLIPRSD